MSVQTLALFPASKNKIANASCLQTDPRRPTTSLRHFTTSAADWPANQQQRSTDASAAAIGLAGKVVLLRKLTAIIGLLKLTPGVSKHFTWTF
jgi:hypothetical protein